MKIAFIAQQNPRDIRSWSGTNYHFLRALEEAGHEVLAIGPLKIPFYFAWRAVRSLILRCTGKLLMVRKEPLVFQSYARQIKRRIKGESVDLILSSTYEPLAGLELDIPMVFFADACYAQRDGNFYYSFLGRSANMARRYEAKVIDRCIAVFYGADWAADAARAYGDSVHRKVHVLPFGANMVCNRTAEQVKQLIDARRGDACSLLLVGVDWDRKGCAFAVSVAKEMRELGIEVMLDVVGCQPPEPMPDFVKIHGFVSKETVEGQQKLNQLYEAAHFFICPSVEECYGVVFCEAASCGLPSIATRVGGISTIVQDGETGILVDLESDPHECALRVADVFRNSDAYENMSLNSYKRYETVLNWSAAVKSFQQVVQRGLDRGA